MRRHSKSYNFIGDAEKGVTVRWGRTLREDPKRAPWPELADISISNKCSKGCGHCYRDSSPDGGLMSLEDYRFVLDELTDERWGSVFQVAIGGGEPLEHPDFVAMVEETRSRGIVPNFTTNGKFATEELAELLAGVMGAAAVSVSGFSTEELRGARILSSGGLRTNLHFILSSESLAVARAFLEGRFDAELSGINAVVFLTYKRAGRARAPLWLGNGPELDGFLSAVEAPRTALSFGFDACFAPILIRSTGLDARVFDSCECAFFSVYIDERLRVRPCSFSNGSSTCFDLREHSFREVWERGFEEYREKMLSSPCALLCELGESCRGACPVFPELALCADHRRESYE